MAEILIEGRRLDVFEGLDFSFNYSIADVRDPNKRSTSFSKTIKCPATKNNDVLFGNIWSTNISNLYDSNSTNIEVNFNPNKKANALVIQDGVTVMDGVVQLRSINIEKGAYEYEVVFIGKLAGFFEELGKKKLAGIENVDGTITPFIDWSDLNHVYDRTEIENSWSNTDGYVYPMIDYGDDFEYDNGIKVWRVRQFRPALFAKTIWDRVFDYAGYTYTSSFINSTPFNKLIVPFAGERLYADDSQIADRSFQASQSSVDGAYVIGDFIPVQNVDEIYLRQLRLDDDSTGENSDVGNNWNTSTWQYLVPNDGFYSFDIEQSVRLQRILSNPNRTYTGAVKIHVQIMKQDTFSNVSVVSENVLAFTITNNPSTFLEEITLQTSINEELFLQGERVFFRFLVNFQDLLAQNLIGQRIDGSNLFSDFDMTTESATGRGRASSTIFEGDNLTVSQVVPDMTMKDFIMSIVKMFNLYVEIDPLNENNLIIETRSTYLQSGQIQDWTNKLARDENIKLEPLSMLTAKVYDYKYKEDSDYYNERFQNTYQEPYGTRRYEIDNDFLTNTEDIEVAFSATPLQIDGNSDRFVSRIYDNDISEGAKPTESNIRILYYERYFSTPVWSFKKESDNSTTSQILYPYAGHLDNPLSPTLDLCFGIPDELYYQANGYTGTIIYTNANLFNVYHRDYVEEITNKDSKLMEGYFYLNANDIEKLDFRDQILIDNTYWRLNRVRDYNPFKDGLTKVELIKVIDLVSQDFDTFNVGSIGGVGTVNPEKKPVNDKLSKKLSRFNSYNGKVNGRNNKINPNAFDFKVIGNDNVIGGSTRNVTIIGDGNYVAAGLENVVLINSDNQEVYESNVTYQDGYKMPNCRVQCASLTIASADVLQLNTTPLTIVAAQGAGTAIEPISASYDIDFNTTAYATYPELTLIEDGATNPIMSTGNSLDSTISRNIPFSRAGISFATDTQILENTALQVSVVGGNPTAGDSDITVRVLYRIVSV